jgi:hypothetical protein
MTAAKTRCFAKCITEAAGCLKDERVWNQVGWSALIEDLDDMIAKKRADIKTLIRSRRVAQRNLELFKPYPKHLQDSAFDVKPDAKSQAIHQNNMRIFRERREKRSVAK